MSSISYVRETGDDYVIEQVTTDVQTAEIVGHIPARHAVVTVEDGEVTTGGTDTETVTVTLVSGLEVARGTDPSAASTLTGEQGDVSLVVDGSEFTVSLTDGAGTKDVTTTKSGGSTIRVATDGYSAAPIDNDSAEIEVVA